MLEEMKELLTISQAAAKLGVTRQSLYYAISRGHLAAELIAGVTFVSTAALARYQPDRERQTRIKAALGLA